MPPSPADASSEVAQEMPETDQSATAFVIEGDTALTAAQNEVDAAEASGDGERMAHAYMDLHDAGSHDAEARAQAMPKPLGETVQTGNAEIRFEKAQAVGPRPHRLRVVVERVQVAQRAHEP